MPSDAELLRRYVESGSQEAFGELVRRHLGLVYHSALRRVGRNAHAADDVTQAVFTGLARKARTLQHHPNLAGWLYTATRFAAADSVRAERRRRTHEQEAETMKELNSEAPVPSERLEPFLDEALDLMDQRDREAVLLHYFEGQTFAEVGSALSLSADAARMRVNRALERLRLEFARRGVASSAAALAAALTAQSVMSVSIPSALTVAGRALSQAAKAPAGASFFARALQALKSPVALSSAAVGGVVVATAVAIRHTRIADEAVIAGAPSPAAAAESPSAQADATVIEADPAAVPPAAARPSAAPPSAQPAPASSPEYQILSPGEQILLARLLYLREFPPSGSPDRWVLQVPQSGPAAPGISPLLGRGLIEQGPRGGVRLTPAGVSYCETNAGLIRASAYYKRAGN